MHQRMVKDMVGRVQYLARKKLILAMSLNADQTINRAAVAGCAISATRNHLNYTCRES
jgi:hypothetical protein